MRTFTSWTVNRSEGGYTARFYFRDEGTGKVSRVTRRMRGVSRRAAEERAREEFGRLDRAEHAAALAAPDERDDPMALGGFLGGYVGFLRDSGCIGTTTVANYSRICAHVTRGIDPKARIDSIRASDVAAMQARLLREGLAASTVAKAHTFLKQAMAYGVEMGVLESSPFTRSLRPPIKVRPEPNALDDEGRARLLSMLDELGDTPVSLGARLALGCGLRREEVCGLTWRDVDPAGRLLHIRRAVVVVEGRCVVKEPKTRSSRRDVDLDPDLAARLAARKRDVGRPGAAGDSLYVLGSPDGAFMRPERLSRSFTMLVRSMGLLGTTGEPVTFRDLRHTYATFLIARGVDVKTVASLMGHSTPTLTLSVYAAADPKARRAAAEVVREAMAARPAPSER